VTPAELNNWNVTPAELNNYVDCDTCRTKQLECDSCRTKQLECNTLYVHVQTFLQEVSYSPDEEIDRDIIYRMIAAIFSSFL
jgi:hypothetical protein